MSDISQRTIGTYLNEDQRWIAPEAKPGVDVAPGRTITLDRSAFDLVTAFPNWLLPSGIVLAEVTSSGLYIPYVNQTNESVSLTVDGTAGTYTLTLEGDVTPAIAFNATAATVLAALEALPGINPGDVTVTGGVGASGGGTPYVITFVAGQYAGQNAPALTAQDVNLTGGGDALTPVTTTGGVTTPVGEAVAKGFLLATVTVDPLSASTADIPAALYWTGAIVESFLPTGHGLDAAARSDLAGQFTFRS